MRRIVIWTGSAYSGRHQYCNQHERGLGAGRFGHSGPNRGTDPQRDGNRYGDCHPQLEPNGDGDCSTERDRD